MIPSIQDHLHAFAFLFTKYPDDEKDKIHSTLENINKRMTAEEKSDEGFYCLLGGMHQKTRKGAIIVDPVKGDPKTILQELMDIGSISHPDEVFQFSITEKSKAILQEQIYKDQLSIINGLKIHDYEFVKYKLDNIKLLCDLLSFDILKQTYSDCITSIKKHLNEHYHNSINAINRCLIEGNMLTQEDVEQYQRNIVQSKSADLLREFHLKNEVMQSSALVQNLVSQAGTLLINQQDKKFNNKDFKSLFDKIRILSNTFPEIKSKYEELGKILKEKLKITTQSFEEALHKDDFENCGQELTKLSETILLFKDHTLWFEEIKNLYTQLQKLFVKDLRRSIHELDSIFTKERLENQEVRALENCLSRIELAKNTLILHKHVQMENIKSLYDGLLARILDNFERINSKIVALFKEKKESSFEEIEPLMEEMELLRTIHSIDSNTCSSYHTTVNTICKLHPRPQIRYNPRIKINFSTY